MKKFVRMGLVVVGLTLFLGASSALAATSRSSATITSAPPKVFQPSSTYQYNTTVTPKLVLAADVAAGQFGANVGGGDYSFPGFLTVGKNLTVSKGQIKLYTPTGSGTASADIVYTNVGPLAYLNFSGANRYVFDGIIESANSVAAGDMTIANGRIKLYTPTGSGTSSADIIYLNAGPLAYLNFSGANRYVFDGIIKAGNYMSSDGSFGVSQTYQVNTNKPCEMTFKNGLLTYSSCPAKSLTFNQSSR